MKEIPVTFVQPDPTVQLRSGEQGRRADRAQDRSPGPAVPARAASGHPGKRDWIALAHVLDTGTDLGDNSRPFMAEHGRRRRWDAARLGVPVARAHARRGQPDQNLAGARRIERHLGDVERFTRRPENRRLHLHPSILPAHGPVRRACEQVTATVAPEGCR